MKGFFLGIKEFFTKGIAKFLALSVKQQVASIVVAAVCVGGATTGIVIGVNNAKNNGETPTQSSSLESLEEASSEESSSEEVHIHSFDIDKVNANYHWSACECGEETEKIAHSYTDGICICGVEYKEPTEGLEYTLSEDETHYLVTGLGTATEVSEIVIPETHQDLPVRAIGSQAFSFAYNVKEITIPDSIEYVEFYAFHSCDNLEKVYISDLVAWCNIEFADEYSNPVSAAEELYLNNQLIEHLEIPAELTHIGNYAFVGCNSLQTVSFEENSQVVSLGMYAFSTCVNLTEISIPDSVTDIGYMPFDWSDRLTNIMVDENNATYQSIDGNLYTKDGKKLVQYAVAKTDTKFVVPDGVTEIGYNAFKHSNSLQEIVLPEGVTTIESSAFVDCHSLTSITLPESLLYIQSGAFVGCSELKDIVLPKNVKEIGRSAFFGCPYLTKVVIPASVEFIGVEAFYNCYRLTSVTFENTTGWTVDFVEISSAELADEKTSTEYVTKTYSFGEWRRSDE